MEHEMVHRAEAARLSKPYVCHSSSCLLTSCVHTDRVAGVARGVQCQTITKTRGDTFPSIISTARQNLQHSSAQIRRVWMQLQSSNNYDKM
jgi:hypothetical protein